MTFQFSALPDWFKTAGLGIGLVLSHTLAYLRDHRADVARLLLKRSLVMSAVSPLVQTLQADLPALLGGTKKVAKALLDTVYTTGTPDEKAAALAKQLEPGFNLGLESLGMPSWAFGMVDGVFEKLIAAAVAEIEAA